MGESIISWSWTYSSIKPMYNSDLWIVFIRSAAAHRLQRNLSPSVTYRWSQKTFGKKTELQDGAMKTREARIICLENYLLDTAINKGTRQI